MVLLWAPGQTESHSFPNQAYREDELSRVILTGPPASLNAEHFTDNCTEPYGLLRNGLPFVVYRILLFCDDFQQSSQMSKAASAGGCYFLPLSLPVEKRRSSSSVRIISLTPPNTSTNDLLRYIVPDMRQATVHGVDGHTPSGTRLRIFLDVLGFVGDYPASACVVDVLGHVGNAPCTHCSFRRLRNVTNNGSRFGYTTKIHSRNSSFLRNLDRYAALRLSELPDSDANRLGMIPNSRANDRTCPLMYFQRTLEDQRSRSAVRQNGKPVVQCIFEAYRNNVIAPDNLPRKNKDVQVEYLSSTCTRTSLFNQKIGSLRNCTRFASYFV